MGGAATLLVLRADSKGRGVEGYPAWEVQKRETERKAGIQYSSSHLAPAPKKSCEVGSQEQGEGPCSQAARLAGVGQCIVAFAASAAMVISCWVYFQLADSGLSGAGGRFCDASGRFWERGSRSGRAWERPRRRSAVREWPGRPITPLAAFWLQQVPHATGCREVPVNIPAYNACKVLPQKLGYI